MKNLFTPLKVLVTLAIIVCNNLAYTQLSRQQAIDKVLTEIVVSDTGSVNVYSKIQLSYLNDSLSLHFDSVLSCPYNYNWLFFVDDHPYANWTHSTRYIFIDSITGNFSILNSKQPPAVFALPTASSEFEKVSGISTFSPAPMPADINRQPSNVTPNPNLYAVLIVTEDAAYYPDGYPNRF